VINKRFFKILLALYVANLLLGQIVRRVVWGHFSILQANPASNFPLYDHLVRIDYWMKAGLQTAFCVCLAVCANIIWKQTKKRSPFLLGVFCIGLGIVIAYLVNSIKANAAEGILMSPSDRSYVLSAQFLTGFYWVQTAGFLLLYIWSFSSSRVSFAMKDDS